jgi:hypothetical protein
MALLSAYSAMQKRRDNGSSFRNKAILFLNKSFFFFNVDVVQVYFDVQDKAIPCIYTPTCKVRYPSIINLESFNMPITLGSSVYFMLISLFLIDVFLSQTDINFIHGLNLDISLDMSIIKFNHYKLVPFDYFFYVVSLSYLLGTYSNILLFFIL